ncbi:MAG TPA: hypothetical protein VK750_00470 [Cytophagaceae bacterium]|jgi:hypothetical protein|nr:hypothetical protein [Cytophagaceae bacterium]
MKIKMIAFKAIDEVEMCNQFLEGHVKVLEDYGITNITTNNRRWMEIPNVFVVVAIHEATNQIVGGVRVHVADGIEPLPVEKAVGYMDKRVHDLISRYQDGGTGELCGLWNAKTVAGYGISLLLVRAGISIVNQIHLDSLFTICGDYTLPMVHKVGFVVEDSIGNNGEFLYPKENYIARVLRKMNAITLETAEQYDKDRILDLRNNPQQNAIEKGPKGDIEVDYNLVISFK